MSIVDCGSKSRWWQLRRWLDIVKLYMQARNEYRGCKWANDRGYRGRTLWLIHCMKVALNYHLIGTVCDVRHLSVLWQLAGWCMAVLRCTELRQQAGAGQCCGVHCTGFSQQVASTVCLKALYFFTTVCIFSLPFLLFADEGCFDTITCTCRKWRMWWWWWW